MWLFSTANNSAQIYKLYAFIGQEWVSTVWGGNQHKQVHQFHRFSHLCIQENHITTHPLLIHSQQNKQSGSSCNRFAWLSLNFFRCASISWFQVVSRWVIEWLIFFGFKASASVGRLSIYFGVRLTLELDYTGWLFFYCSALEITRCQTPWKFWHLELFLMGFVILSDT